VCIRTYVRIWKREKGVKVTCTLFLFVNGTDYVWWSFRFRLTACIFPWLVLPRMNDVDVTRILSHWGAGFTWVPLLLTFEVLDSRKSPCLSRSGCLIHVSFLASHVREWMSVCFVKRLNFQSEHHSLQYKHLLSFESNWLLEEFPQQVRIELLHLFYESYCPS